MVFTTATAQDNKIRIACVGNSITYGSRVENREKNAYPVQLQAMLGEGYEVANFGVSGATLLKKGTSHIGFNLNTRRHWNSSLMWFSSSWGQMTASW